MDGVCTLLVDKGQGLFVSFGCSWQLVCFAPVEGCVLPRLLLDTETRIVTPNGTNLSVFFDVCCIDMQTPQDKCSLLVSGDRCKQETHPPLLCSPLQCCPHRGFQGSKGFSGCLPLAPYPWHDGLGQSLAELEHRCASACP